MAQEQQITSSPRATQRLQPQPARLGAQPEHREVSCCDREGTSTATSKSITTGKLDFPKRLERLFTLGQVIAELMSWFVVTCLVTARANNSLNSAGKEKGHQTDPLHGSSLQHGDFGSTKNKFIFVSSISRNRTN